MLPDFTLFLKQAHMDEIYELSMRPLLHALLKRQNKKGGIFFFPLRCVKSHRGEVQLSSPGHRPGAVPSPLPAAEQPWGCRELFRRGTV